MVEPLHWSVKEKNDPFVVPSFETISFSLPSLEKWEDLLKGRDDGWVYLSDGNPTLAALEKMLAATQMTEACWVTSTGKAAIAATLLALLKSGDHLIMLKEGYKSTRLFAEGVLRRFGVETSLLPVDSLSELESRIKESRTKESREKENRTTVLVLEAPTNPMTRVPDLKACTDIARRHGVLSVLDNSLAGFHQNSDAGADVIVHSLSKYASGIGDVMGGAVLGKTAMVRHIKSSNVWNTDTMSAHTAMELWKGMQTYRLRVDRQAENALAVAQFLESHPQVTRVLYPGLASHPDHATAKEHMSDFGSVLAFDVKNADALRNTLDRLKVFRIAFGTGFTQSIANPAWLFYARSFPEEQSGLSAIKETTIRLSIGIEPASVLIEDLRSALE